MDVPCDFEPPQYFEPEDEYEEALKPRIKVPAAAPRLPKAHRRRISTRGFNAEARETR